MTTQKVKLRAMDFIDESETVVDSAARIAARVRLGLVGGGAVTLSLLGVRGASSSFFNVILATVSEVLHNDFSGGRFEIETDSPTQKLVYQRSLDAFKMRGK